VSSTSLSAGLLTKTHRWVTPHDMLLRMRQHATNAHDVMSPGLCQVVRQRPVHVSCCGKPPHIDDPVTIMCVSDVCRQMTESSNQSVLPYSISGSISWKTLFIMEEITYIIKAMATLGSNDELAELNRSLYRSIDKLTELKCNLLQQQVLMLSKHTSSKPKVEFVDLTTTEAPTSEKTSSSTSILGKTKSKPSSKDRSTQDKSIALSILKETPVNQPSANTCAGIVKYLYSDGAKLVTYYISCQNSLTNLHTFLTYHDQNLKTGQGMTSQRQWRELKMAFSSTRNMNAAKLL